MSRLFFKNLIKYSHFIPNNIFKIFQFNKFSFIKSNIPFDTVQYKSDYKNDNFSFFFLPLFINIYQISFDIQNLINQNKVVSIISVLIFHEKETNIEYIHSLSNSNGLYKLDDFDKWPTQVLFNLIEKLELYNSFKKISLVIKVKTITKF